VGLDLSETLQIVTLVALMAGLLFGLLELRRARRSRADKGALDVLSIAIRPDHIQASYAILDLPVAAPPEAIASSSGLRDAANTLMVLYEFLGNLVFQRMVRLDTVDLLVGGIIRASWDRLRPYIERERVERGLPNIGEWFQWLVERLHEHGRAEKAQGTHVAFEDWRP
jgi:hypothetical protein